MSGDDQLVIHDGQLIPKEKALALMLEEFTPFGYSAATVEMLVQRAFAATQYFLHELSFRSPADRKSHLDIALKKDAEIAAHWRAQPPDQREAHAKHLEANRQRREEAQKEREAAFKRYREAEEERRQRYWQWEKDQREKREQWQKEQREKERKAQLQHQFECWEQHNRRIDEWNEQAEARAAERKRQDDRMTYALIKHIREKEERQYWRMSMVDRTLDLIGDHEYIQWMFDCFCLPSRRWLSGAL